MTFGRSSRSRRAEAPGTAQGQPALLGADLAPHPGSGDAPGGLCQEIFRAPSGKEEAVFPLLAADHRPEVEDGDPVGLSLEPPPLPGRGPRRHPRLRITIGFKFGALLVALLAVLITTSAVLMTQTTTTAREFDDILRREVRQGLLARQMQVHFAKRVQEWKDLLLRGVDPKERAEALERIEEQDRRADALYRQLLATDPDPALMWMLKRYDDSDRAADVAYERAVDDFLQSSGRNYAAADRAVRGVDRPGIEQIDRIVAELERRISARVAAQEASIEKRQQITLTAAGALLFLLSGIMVLALFRIVRPLRQLTRQAERAATDRLPNAVARIKNPDTEMEQSSLPPFVARTRDELRDLAEALTALQSSALEGAVEQHRADRQTSEMLVNLGRRNQNLLGRMLSYVTELERREQDPEILSQLFRLDHATTRIRRNAESMLVLAGAHQTRTWSRPVPVIDVVRAALSEIEEYVRVDLHHIEDCLVNGSTVADAVHLIAELVENATHFSPPTTQVTVIGQRVREGYRLRVIDQGVGMTQRELESANQRIRRVDGERTNAKLLGLVVVGRLARRRNIEVTLEPSAGRGITASILLPESTLGLGPAPTGSVDAPASAPAGASRSLPALGTRRAVAGPRVAGAPAAFSRTRAVPGLPTTPGPAGPVLPAPVSPRSAPTRPTPVPAVLLPPAEDPVGPAPTLPSSIPPSSGVFAARGASDGYAGSGDSAQVIDLTREGAPVSQVPQAIPRRVRGAQLPDLGPAAEPVIARPDDGPGAAESLRWQLRSFQLDVQAARRAINESEPGDGPGPRNGQHLGG
jgi:signal transduction histidine kinase